MGCFLRFCYRKGQNPKNNPYLCQPVKTDVLYIVVPCCNEQAALPMMHEQLLTALGRLVNDGTVSTQSRVLYVDDGSTDDTWQLISDYARNECVSGIKLSANVGHQNALLAGLEHAIEHADVMVTIDADGQDDATVINEMIALYRAGNDIVLGVRRERRADTWFKRTTAHYFYKVMTRLGVKSVQNHADFRLMSRRAVSALLRYRERNLYLRGMVSLVGFKTDRVYYDRQSRLAGESKYPLRRMMAFAVDGITSFSIRPVRLVLTLGIVFLFIALTMLVYVLVAYFGGRAVSGWASMILSLWFIGGCVLIGLGIVGEYIGKIYIEVKDRPRYHIEQCTMHHAPCAMSPGDNPSNATDE